ncbi:hypothetical protein Nmel_011133 [Mimus melanotis]
MLCLPSMTREMLTMRAQSTTSTRSGTARTRWRRTKRQTRAALVAWPEGKEYLSTEMVTNMSILLCVGRGRLTSPFTTATITRSSSSAGRDRNGVTVLGCSTGCDQKYVFYHHLLKPGVTVILISVGNTVC